MWVWIPRYIYKISSGWHTSTAGTIGAQFSMETDDTRGGTVTLDTDTTSNASNNKWTNHPAFTFGTTQLTGIWVAKFEASKDGSSNAKFIPNITSWRSISANDIFTKTRSMETNSMYGWGTTGSGIDTHMMKNTEWGAATYLAKSTYGKSSEIALNNNSSCLTGYGNSSAYDTTQGALASTTGNIYGIYDMSGGSSEFTAAYVNNGSASLASYGNSLVTADSKYKDVYTKGSTDTNANNYALTINHKGDAMYETSANGSDSAVAWYSDISYMPRVDSPFFLRSGYYGDGASAGAFYFYPSTGGVYVRHGFRAVVLVEAGL
jgi:hypothetical protein